MIARWFYLSLKKSVKESLCWILDCSFFYHPPFQWIKTRALNGFFGAELAPDCILVAGVRAVNWRNVRAGAGVYLADGVNLRSQGPIRIGPWSTLGPGVMVISGGHSTTDLAPTSSSITIGKGVFVGARADSRGSDDRRSRHDRGRRGRLKRHSSAGHRGGQPRPGRGLPRGAGKHLDDYRRARFQNGNFIESAVNRPAPAHP